MTQTKVRSPSGQRFQRFLSLSQESKIDVEKRIVSFSFSSEMPIESWWWNQPEILLHGPENADLSRLNDGAPFLWNHDRDAVIGVIESAEIRSDRRGYCTARFARNALGDEYFGLVQDGIVRNVSFAYEIDSWMEEEGTVKALKWTAFEVSLVSIPADPSVGLGRSQQFLVNEIRGQKMTEITQKYSMDQSTEAERERASEISGIGAMLQMPDLAQKAINEGWTIEQAKGHFFDAKQAKLKRESYRGGNIIQSMSRRELQTYSLVRALRAACDGDTSNSFEREISEEVKRSTGIKSRGGLHVPSAMLLSQRDAVVKYGDGGSLVETTLMDGAFVETLRSKTLVGSMGAQYLPGLVGDVEIPRQASAATVQWVGESQALSESQPEFDNVTLEPKQIGAITRISRLMLQQSTPAIEDLVRSDLSAIVAIGIDAAAIAGTGTSNMPLGILRNPDVNVVSLGTNGGALDWDAILELEASIARQNADGSSMGFLTNSSVRKVLKSTLMNPAATNSEWIWSDEAMMSQVAGAAQTQFGAVNGYRTGISENVPSNLTKGTGTNLSGLIFGNWSDLLIGEWGSVELLPNPYAESAYAKGELLIRIFATVDVALRHPESFSVIKDILTT